MESLKNLTIEELEGIKKFVNAIQAEKREEFILVEDNLHKIDEIKPNPDYIPENEYYMKSNRFFNVQNSAGFLNIMNRRMFAYHKNDKIRTDLLNKLSFIKNWNNIFLAGGSISNYVNNFPRGETDYDLFFYGLNEEQAYKKVQELLNSYEKENGGYNLIVSKYAITINNTVQIILRLYANKEDILNSFDIEGSCIGFDGVNVLLNNRGKFAYETGYITVDLARNSPTYSHRLVKYRKKGFGIILKNLKSAYPPFKLGQYQLKYVFCNERKVSGQFKSAKLLENNTYYDSYNQFNVNYRTLYCINKGKNNNIIPIMTNKIGKEVNISEEFYIFYKGLLEKCRKVKNVNSKLLRHFTQEVRQELVNAVQNDKFDQFLALEMNRMIRDCKNIVKSLNWENYLDGFKMDEIYKYPITYNEFYGQ